MLVLLLPMRSPHPRYRQSPIFWKRGMSEKDNIVDTNENRSPFCVFPRHAGLLRGRRIGDRDSFALITISVLCQWQYVYFVES